MIRALTFLSALLMASSGAFAGEAPVYTGLFSNTGAGGYDPVSYFQAGQPVKGSTEYTTEYEGTSWRFANAENLKLFQADPVRYAPVYGGYCAWAVGHGKLAKGDPLQWSIVDDKLYLNYNDPFKKRWLKDANALIQQGNANWPAVLK